MKRKTLLTVLVAIASGRNFVQLEFGKEEDGEIGLIHWKVGVNSDQEETQRIKLRIL